MDYFIQLVLSGLVVGAIYGLVAMGFAVIFKSTGIVNFAQGEMAMLTAYMTWSLANMLGTGAIVTIVIAIVLGALLGLLCERLIMRPMLGEPVLSVVLVTIGLAVVLRALVTIIWGASPHKFELGGADALVELGSTSIRISQLSVIGFLVVALAGLAGAIFAVIFGLMPSIFELGLKAFLASVLGGFDSILGSGFSGLIIGVFENQVGGYLSSTLKEVAGFLLILVVLMVRPFGLFGEKRIERV